MWAQGLLGGGKGNELPGACQGTHDTRPTHTHRVWMVLLVKVEAATRTRDVDAVAAAFAVLVVVLLLLLQIGCGCNLARKAATGAWTAGVVLVLQGHHRIDYLHRDLAHDLGLVALQWHVPLLAVLLQGLRDGAEARFVRPSSRESLEGKGFSGAVQGPPQKRLLPSRSAVGATRSSTRLRCASGVPEAHRRHPRVQAGSFGVHCQGNTQATKKEQWILICCRP